MKITLVILCMLFVSTAALAAVGVERVEGLIGLSQYQCTITALKFINTETGEMKNVEDIFTHVVVASNASEAYKIAVNKFKIYGPFKGYVFFETESGEQFKITKVLCQ